MAKLIFRVSVCLVLCLSFASSQAVESEPIHPDPDILGVYFDLDAVLYASYTSAPLEHMYAYLLLVNPSDPGGVAAWEGLVRVSGYAVLQEWELAAGMNILDTQSGEFHVAIGTGASALVAAPVVLLATWSGYVMSPTTAVLFHVEPYPGSLSFPDSPGYVSGETIDRFIPLGSNFGDYDLPSAAINPYGTPAETMSWGEVKTLFR